MHWNPDDGTTAERYALLTSVIVPRPIAWVTTKNGDGVINLAPFSYFNGIGSDPLMISLSVADKRAGEKKDTLRNIEVNGQFCVHLVEERFLTAMNASSADAPPDVSEVELLGLTTVPCVVIDGARLTDVRAALECRLIEIHRYGRRSTTNLIVAEVVHVFVDDNILIDDRPLRETDGTPAPVVDAAKISPLARLGGPQYASLGDRIHAARPTVSDLHAPLPSSSRTD